MWNFTEALRTYHRGVNHGYMTLLAKTMYQVIQVNSYGLFGTEGSNLECLSL